MVCGKTRRGVRPADCRCAGWRSCNQLRQKIGVVYGNPETTTGGNALKFYASVRLDIRKTGQIKNGDLVVGSKARVKVVKNKVAPPFREAEFEISYGSGVNWSAEIVDLGAEAGVLEKSGSYFSYKGERIGQGRDNACRWMSENPRAAEEIRGLLVERRKAENLPASPATATAAAAAAAAAA